ncbi:type II toxin-antitoxin system HipA family toxin [Endothiovibrio diazotrophicus]
MVRIDTLQVRLNETPVGTLTLDRNERCEFRLLESYKRSYPRPVLGQRFLDDPDRVYATRARVPPWFSNLLPEGPLRGFIARQAGVVSSREFFLLHHLGGDLPGAVRITADEPPTHPDDTSIQTAGSEPENEDGLHFSLAGVQLKFSANRADRGLTIPVSGRGGDWIVKLPDNRYPRVPENEAATLSWARAAGIEVPAFNLVDIDAIDGIPPALRTFTERKALSIRRFDREDGGRRVHMEDFTQILGLFPEEKYDKYNYETIARLTLALTGNEGLNEFIRRLVFVIASGNGDAHHKNWTLLYPDGQTPKLSPAYDLVSTIQYLPDGKLALNFGKSKQWEDYSLDAFRRLGRKLEMNENDIAEQAEQAAHDTLAALSSDQEQTGYSAAMRATLRDHWKRIPLLAAHAT